MDKLEDDKKGLKLWVFENLLATVFQSSFVGSEAVILSFASDFFLNVGSMEHKEPKLAFNTET